MVELLLHCLRIEFIAFQPTGGSTGSIGMPGGSVSHPEQLPPSGRQSSGGEDSGVYVSCQVDDILPVQTILLGQFGFSGSGCNPPYQARLSFPLVKTRLIVQA